MEETKVGDGVTAKKGSSIKLKKKSFKLNPMQGCYYYFLMI